MQNKSCILIKTNPQTYATLGRVGGVTPGQQKLTSRHTKADEIL
jgi:hypothetical protein